jgi:hypothetical protein
VFNRSIKKSSQVYLKLLETALIVKISLMLKKEITFWIKWEQLKTLEKSTTFLDSKVYSFFAKIFALTTR